MTSFLPCLPSPPDGRDAGVAGAVLDTFREEPLPVTHPFWKSEGILVLPHIGGGHPNRTAVVADLFADNTRRLLAGEPLKEFVDRALGY